MIFTTYDNVKSKKVDRSKTWINPKYKELFSAEYKFRGYYQLISKFDPKLNITKYFIVFTNTKDEDTKKCKVDELGRCRISLASIWKGIGGNEITKDTQVNLEYEESIMNSDIFRIYL